jgi:uncharacterized membrane protein
LQLSSPATTDRVNEIAGAAVTEYGDGFCVGGEFREEYRGAVVQLFPVVAAVFSCLPDLRRSCAMSDEFGNTPPQAGAPQVEQPWGTPVNTGYQQAPPPPGYTAPPPGYTAPPPGYAPAPAAGSGLSDSAAGAIAYITIIPAIIFLVMDPYKDKPFVKFHAFQSLGLAVIWFCLYVVLAILSVVLHFIPFMGFLMLLIYPIAGLCLFIVWLLCILKASQGGSFKLPVVGNFAAQQSGYHV